MSWSDWIRLALAIALSGGVIVGAVILRWRMAELQDRENDRKDGRHE